MNPALNPLVLSLKESATLAINLKARELKAQGQDIIHFGFGESPFPVPEIIQEGLRNNTDKKSYLPTQGLPELCEAVANFYQNEFQYHFTQHNVCIGPGSKELIFQIIYLMEGPLLVPAPSWVSYGPQASLRGKELVPILTQKKNNYRLTPEELDQACYKLGQSQKLLILNNPNNPTGCVYHENDIRELAEICRAYHVIVISDEIYAMIDYTQRPHCSMAKYYPERTIVTGGLSKSFAAGGYRLGVMLIPDDLNLIMMALKSIVSETFSAVSAPIQYAALEAYGKFDQIRPFVKKTSEIYHTVGQYIYEQLTAMHINCSSPEGSFYIFPDFNGFKDKLRKKGILTGTKLCETLIEEKLVAVLPGSDFYLPATDLGFRLAFVDFAGEKVFNSWPGKEKLSNDQFQSFFPKIIEGCNRIKNFVCELD